MSTFARSFVAALGFVSVTAVSGMAGGAAKPVTFNKDVAPIFYQRCVVCHYPKSGSTSTVSKDEADDPMRRWDPHGGAPMSLVDYKTAKAWATKIRSKVLAREMPPWNADPRYGKFKNDPTLSDEEIATIVRWVNMGAPEGKPADLPPAPVQGGDTEWRIGQPDLVLSMEKPFLVPADKEIDMQYFILDPKFTEDKWIEKVQIRVGNGSVVHHTTLRVMEPGQQKVRPRWDQFPGVVKMPLWQFRPGLDKGEITEVERKLAVAEVRTHEAFGSSPEGTARVVSAGSKFVLQMHYNPNGKETTDQSQVGLVFAKKGAVLNRMRNLSVLNMEFVVPAGDPNHEVKAEATFLKDVHFYGFSPHMHFRGKDMKYELFYPDGKSEVLLYVPKYDFFRQGSYDLAEPVAVPKGSRVVVTAHFDNSAGNKLNPNPNVDVPRGMQSAQEMMNGHINFMIDEERANVVTAANERK